MTENAPKILTVIWKITKNAINLELSDVYAEMVLFAKKESAQQLAAHTTHSISKSRRDFKIYDIKQYLYLDIWILYFCN